MFNPLPKTLSWLRLNLVHGVGPVIFSRLLETFGDDVEAIFSAPVAQLKQIKGVGDAVANALRDPQFADAAKVEFDLAHKHDIQLLTRPHPDYPAGLRAIGDAPPVLYVRGTLHESDTVAVALVGTRQPSSYGRDQARRFATQLAQAGVCVVSGFARGIDTEAHKAALAAKGRTIAVIGSGLLNVYPPENEALVSAVCGAGALISEFPLTTAPDKGNFPRRNRLIAALSLGTLVIEAGEDSGALITARCATEYNREVFALPGRVDNPNAQGCHRLIKEGAKLVEDVADVLDELGPLGDELRRMAREASHAKERETAPDRNQKRERDLFGSEMPDHPAARSLSADEAAVFAVLSREPMHADALATTLNLPAHRVGAALTMLELKALVKQLAGRHFVRR